MSKNKQWTGSVTNGIYSPPSYISENKSKDWLEFFCTPLGHWPHQHNWVYSDTQWGIVCKIKSATNHLFNQWWWLFIDCRPAQIKPKSNIIIIHTLIDSLFKKKNKKPSIRNEHSYSNCPWVKKLWVLTMDY